ncbi:MAG: hypothetical protein ACTSUT_10610 [Promethearchaeota archaeon]
MNYNKIKELSKQKKISFRKLSIKIDLTETGLYAAIRNNTLKVKDLEAISRVFKVPVKYFFEDIEMSEKSNLKAEKAEKSDSEKLFFNKFQICKKELDGLKRENELLKEMNLMLKNK